MKKLRCPATLNDDQSETQCLYQLDELSYMGNLAEGYLSLLFTECGVGLLTQSDIEARGWIHPGSEPNAIASL